MFQRRLKQTRVQTLSIGKRYELLFQSNIPSNIIQECVISMHWVEIRLMFCVFKKAH